MELQIPSQSGTGSSNVNVQEAVFGQNYNETLIHQLVVRYLAGGRAGTKAQKTRTDVSGGGAKPWRQKGTGRARSGSSRSPIWRTGGKVFAARPRDHGQKLNKQMFRVGLKSILSELLRQNRIIVNDNIVPSEPKTKLFVNSLKGVEATKILIIVAKFEENLALASRNIPYIEVLEASNLNPVLLVAAEKVIFTKDAIKILEERLI